MDPGSLLVLACVGGIALGVWDLTRHAAADLLGSLAKFLGGMLLGASSFLFLSELAATSVFLIAATASSFIAWSGLARVIRRRLRSLPAVEDEGDEELGSVLALQGRADRLESHGGAWIGPILAFVFALILVGMSVRSSDLASLFAAAVVMVVPFGRLARHHVERAELKGVERLLSPTEEAGLVLGDTGDAEHLF